MLGLGAGELLLVGILLLVVLGPERLPEVMRWLGRQYWWLRRNASELYRDVLLEADQAAGTSNSRRPPHRIDEDDLDDEDEADHGGGPGEPPPGAPRGRGDPRDREGGDA